VQRSQADATAARADLGWTADWTFDAGLREVVTWMRAREQ
jgi:nucleoside-diphosphate-sugar epimerase